MQREYKEYIEREKALEKVIEVKHHDPELSGDVLHRYIKEIDLKDIPAADVVEVVRCKDCKYSGMYCFGTSKEETLACLETEEDGFIRFATSVKADDYCSRGERKMDKEVADDKEQPEEAPGE